MRRQQLRITRRRREIAVNLDRETTPENTSKLAYFHIDTEFPRQPTEEFVILDGLTFTLDALLTAQRSLRLQHLL